MSKPNDLKQTKQRVIQLFIVNMKGNLIGSKYIEIFWKNISRCYLGGEDNKQMKYYVLQRTQRKCKEIMKMYQGFRNKKTLYIPREE